MYMHLTYTGYAPKVPAMLFILYLETLAGGTEFRAEKLVGDLSFETRPVSVNCGQLLKQGHALPRGIYCTLVVPKNEPPVPSLASMPSSFRVLLILGNKRKSTSARPRLYGGWESVATPFLASNLGTVSAVWRGALSGCTIQLSQRLSLLENPPLKYDEWLLCVLTLLCNLSSVLVQNLMHFLHRVIHL
ncbi:hypothetical protein TNCT_546321 [Trichonephila clavata]|uniref:Uncharacterized protein n=1 Tax=Trichonephila clavata TaxID=2740835 RepID=A0A8X6G725_TRICU|nr:hypothetical protein TNCT_546321 [Trichonephila clavata]